MGRYTVVSYANSTFLQLFLWERFSNLAPQPVQFESVTMRTFEDEDGIVRTVPDKPARMRAQRWSNLKQQKGKDLMDYIDSEKHFCFRPYGSTPRGVVEAKLYAPLGGKTVEVSAKRVSAELVSWMTMVAPTLLPFITESKTGAVSYNPQRVMRQLGYDQSAVQISGGTGYSDSSLVESQFVGDGKSLVISKFKTVFWPSGARVGVKTPGGSVYWRTLLHQLCVFVEQQSKESLLIPKVLTVYCNDAFLRARKKAAGASDPSKKSLGRGRRNKSPPTSMEIAEQEAEELAREGAAEEDDDETLEVRKSRRLVKGKAKVILPSNPKRVLPKLDEVPRKRRKLLEASSAATATVTI